MLPLFQNCNIHTTIQQNKVWNDKTTTSVVRYKPLHLQEQQKVGCQSKKSVILSKIDVESWKKQYQYIVKQISGNFNNILNTT